MTVKAPSTNAVNETVQLHWLPAARLAQVRFASGALLTVANAGELFTDTLSEWIGSNPAPFGVLIDAGGVAGVELDYRARLSRFFSQHRRAASIAVFGMSPPMRVLAELFQLGTGVPLRTFADEAAARAWLRQRGIPA